MEIDLEKPELLTEEQITSQDILDELYSIPDDLDQTLTVSAVMQRAKELQLTGIFKANWAAMKRQMRKEAALEDSKKAEKKAEIILSNTYDFKDASEIVTTYNTGHWYCTDQKGVYELGGKGEKLFASHYPVIILSKLTNKDTGFEKVIIAWRKDGQVRSCPVPREILASNTKLVGLARLGVPVTSETAKAMVRYLYDFEMCNPQIPAEVSSGKFGWAGSDYQNAFVPYTDRILFDSETSFGALVESVMNHGGNLEAWMKEVLRIRSEGRIEPMLCLAASFGSIIPQLQNSLPFIVNLYGETGCGKTVCMMLAASVWANPQGRGYIAESNSTLNALEMKLNVLNNLPLMIDDLSKIRNSAYDKGKFADIVYTLCAGGGKSRMTKDLSMRETSSWCNVILSNMERPLADDTMNGGAVNRVLDFEMQEGDVFPEETGDGNAVVDVISKHYGWAGPLFVKAVRDNMNELPELVKKFKEDILDQAKRTGEKKTPKQVVPLAILLTSDYLSEKHIFHDGKHLSLPYCVSMLKNEEDISEMERAYEHFKDEIISHPAMFNAAAYNDPDENPREFWGKWQADGEYIAIIPSRLDDIAQRCNFSVKQFISWLDARGMLQKESGRTKKRVRFGPSVSYRCYCIRFVEETDPATRKAEITDLPFD